MKITPPQQWLAGLVNRWHAGPSAPYLAHTQDRICGHQGRMGVLALHYWPYCSRELLVACLCHDLGEYAAGDAPHPAKANAGLKNALDQVELETLKNMGLSFKITRDDYYKIAFLDRLDAYLWAQVYAPQIMATPEWQIDREKLIDMADDLGVVL